MGSTLGFRALGGLVAHKCKAQSCLTQSPVDLLWSACLQYSLPGNYPLFLLVSAESAPLGQHHACTHMTHSSLFDVNDWITVSHMANGEPICGLAALASFMST